MHKGEAETAKVIDEIDIWRTAKLQTDQHGSQAAIHAAMQAGPQWLHTSLNPLWRSLPSPLVVGAL